MRRHDREITDPADLRGILERCDVCRLGLLDGEYPYIVPLNFGFTLEDGALTLVFHCAHEGKKLDLIRRNPHAFFEMDGGHNLVVRDDACAHTMEYESVMGRGLCEIVTDPAEKTAALARLMRQYVPDRAFSFTEAQAAAVTVLKMTVSEFTGKRLTADSRQITKNR